MSFSSQETLFNSPLLKVIDIVCQHPQGGCGCERGGERTHLTMLRRGGFGYHMGVITLVGDPTMALLYRSGDSYRISHPFRGGDECTTFEVPPQHEEEVFGRRRTVRTDLSRQISAAKQFAHLKLHSSLKRGHVEPLVVEEAAAALCGSVLRDEPWLDGSLRISTIATAQIVRAKEAVLADPAGGPGLSGLAAIAGCSPFHLARIFRKATGLTLTNYRTRLRIALSLCRLSEGVEDLSALAQEAGFSHHSHFSSTFFRHVGMPPSVARRSMRSAELKQRSTNLIAATERNR